MQKVDKDESEVLSAFEKGTLKSVATKAELSKFKEVARATAASLSPQTTLTDSGAALAQPYLTKTPRNAITFPEKEFFTLEEIIARWRFAGCDRATLLSYARGDLLVFSVYLRELGNHKTVRETPEGRITTTHTVAFQFASPTFKWHSIRYLKADDARRILEGVSGEEIGVGGLFSSPKRDKASGTGYLQAIYFTYPDLVITRNERDRFEAEHKINLASGRVARAWHWLSDASNQKALSIIGVGIAAVFGAAWSVFLWWSKAGASP